MKVFLAFIGTLLLSSQVWSQELRYTDEEVINSYYYILGRMLILRQEHRDFKLRGHKWNRFIHNNSSPDVAESTAWMGIDKKSCSVLDIPEARGHYLSVQVYNGWGESVHEINSQSYPDHLGRFVYCLPGVSSNVEGPHEKIILPYKKTFIRVLVGKGENFRKIQRSLKLASTGKPKIDKTYKIKNFGKRNLPGIEAFQNAKRILQLEEDQNPASQDIQATLMKIHEISLDPSEQKPIDQIIKKWAIPALLKLDHSFEITESKWEKVGKRNQVPSYLARTLRNLSNIWQNPSEEFHYRLKNDSLGEEINALDMYTLTFSSKDLAPDKKWSLMLNSRKIISNETSLSPNPDGSLTLYLSSHSPIGVRSANWISLKNVKNVEIELNLYGSQHKEVEHFPPALTKVRHRIGQSRLR